MAAGRESEQRRQYYPEAGVLESEFGEGWMLVEQYERQPDGRRVIVELKICPVPKSQGVRDAGRAPGATPPRDEAPVPDGGITARLLRTVRVGRVGDVIDDFREALSEFGPAAVAAFDARAPRRRRPKPKRGVNKPETFYAELARDYARLVRRPKPVTYLARMRRVPVADIKSWVRLCRLHGYLTDAEPGKAGGELTPKALGVLSGARTDAPETTQQPTTRKNR